MSSSNFFLFFLIIWVCLWSWWWLLFRGSCPSLSGKNANESEWEGEDKARQNGLGRQKQPTFSDLCCASLSEFKPLFSESILCILCYVHIIQYRRSCLSFIIARKEFMSIVCGRSWLFSSSPPLLPRSPIYSKQSIAKNTSFPTAINLVKGWEKFCQIEIRYLQAATMNGWSQKAGRVGLLQKCKQTLGRLHRPPALFTSQFELCWVRKRKWFFHMHNIVPTGEGMGGGKQTFASLVTAHCRA